MVVELKDVTKAYPESEGGGVREVLCGVDLAIEKGDSLSILGSSGCGKSTLLNIMGTLDRATSGTVRLFGDSISDATDEAALSALRSQQIGFIFQLHHLLPQCSVLENVLVPTLAAKSAGADAVERGKKLLDRVGLTDLSNKRPASLSGGERQRVAVVRALINEPALILADEPTGALDAANAKTLIDLLVELNEESQAALVMVTHDRDLGARMGKVLKIEDGKLS